MKYSAYHQQAELPNPEDELLTAREVAHRFRVDETTIRRWVFNGTLEAVILPMVGKRRITRFKRSYIEELLTPRRLESTK